MNAHFVTTMALSAILLLSTGCATTHQTHTNRGAALGTGLGAAAGAIIGHQSGNAGEGALIGAAAGALTGGLAGKIQDTADERDAAIAQAAYQSDQQALRNHDVILMAQNGVGDKIIYSAIQTRGGQFDLSPQGIISLKQNGVSESVIQYMQDKSKPISQVSGLSSGGISSTGRTIFYIAPSVRYRPRPHVVIHHPPHRHRRRHRHRY